MKAVMRILAVLGFILGAGSELVGMEENPYSIVPYAWKEEYDGTGKYYILAGVMQTSGARQLASVNLNLTDFYPNILGSSERWFDYHRRLRGLYSNEEIKKAINYSQKDPAKSYIVRGQFCHPEQKKGFYVEVDYRPTYCKDILPREDGDATSIREAQDPDFMVWVEAGLVYSYATKPDRKIKLLDEGGNALKFGFNFTDFPKTPFLKKLAEAKEPLQLNDTGKNSSPEPKKQKEFKFKMWHGVAIGAGVVGIVGLAVALTAYMVKKETKAEIERARNERAIYEGTFK